MNKLKITITITDPEFLEAIAEDHEDRIRDEILDALDNWCGPVVDEIEVEKE